MRICRCFGWTVGYVLSLTCPQFFCLAGAVRSVRLDEAIDTVYAGYTAGKYGGAASKELFGGRKCFKLAEPEKPKPKEYTPEELKATEERMKRFLARQAAELEQKQGQEV